MAKKNKLEMKMNLKEEEWNPRMNC